MILGREENKVVYSTDSEEHRNNFDKPIEPNRFTKLFMVENEDGLYQYESHLVEGLENETEE